MRRGEEPGLAAARGSVAVGWAAARDARGSARGLWCGGAARGAPACGERRLGAGQAQVSRQLAM